LLCGDNRGISHSVISLTTLGVYGEKLQAIGISVYCLHMSSPKDMLLAPLRLWRLLRKLTPTVVQTWMYHSDLLGGLVAKLQGVPVVWSVRSNGTSASKPSFSRKILLR